ncbi:MAG TPA: glucodextranase DOMON-like domain-containing protein [Gaiellaceae bacterium]
MSARRLCLFIVVGVGLAILPAAASSTPDPTSVTVVGDLQSEAGCASDWDPTCAQTHLTYDASDDVWQRTFLLPAGNYQYKAALNDSWDENYGLHAVLGGDNTPLTLPQAASVKFYYDHKTHWVTDNHTTPIPVAVGDFQSELGCPADWQPDCLRSWLEDPDGNGIATFETTALPAGSYQAKVAVNEGWDENYGAGGTPNGSNIAFSVPTDHAKVTFSYDTTSHRLTISVADPQGAPGALSHFDLARKDCFGTARNTASKVWYTVAGGVLSDVYYPTIDNTNVETLRYIVTDGSTFTDVQGRDTTYTVAALPGSGGMGCRVTTSAKSGKWQLVTDYITDPARNTLLMNVSFKTSVPNGLRLYQRFDPTVNGNGGGGSGNGGADSALTDTSTGRPILVADDPSTTTNAANRDYAQPVYLALDAPFTTELTNGFAGSASDGLVELDGSHALTTSYAAANNGNVVQTARVAGSGKTIQFTAALGFGSTQAGAVGTAESSLQGGWPGALDAFKSGWQGYDAGLNQPPTVHALPGIAAPRVAQLRDEYYVSANVLKAVEDKTFAGALVAAPASPWGQAISAGDPQNTFFGSYREVFARDLYEIWTGLMADGDTATAKDATLFLFDRQQRPDGSMPRNSLVNGKLAPDSFGTQLDETAYPLLMADELHLTDHDLYEQHIKPAANFVAAHGPSFGVERWEEQSGYSPSSIAAEIAGLIAAADLADANHDPVSAAIWRGTADDFQRSIKSWTVTTSGPFAPRYFIRLSKTGDPNAAITYNLGNGGPTLDQREVIDQGFLELTRLGELRAADPDILASLPVVDAKIRSTTAAGDGFHRYNGDGYGDRSSDGRPWAPSGEGNGHLWPALSAERAEQQLQTGDTAGGATFLDSMARMASGIGLIPEQNWENLDLAPSAFGSDPTMASIGFVNGGAAGSAAPLDWSAGAFVRLARDLATGTLVDRPAATYSRYVQHTQGTTTLTVTQPADQAAVAGSPVTVTGTSASGNTVYVAATNTDNTFATTTATTTVAADGTWSAQVPIDGGTTVLTTVAVAPNGGTAYDQRSIVFDFVPGTRVFDVADPAGDDNGPGNYAYPTSSNFHAGAFDIRDFQVWDSGSDITFRLQTTDLTPTFGSPLGAQLVDVYVHEPGASPTSTSAANASRNFQIAPAFAWSRLLQVQGFGQRYEDASGNTVGTIAISANQISRYITFRVSKASLGGTPGSGWAFTVVLHGQDGFSGDKARGFAPTPQDFLFGVCAALSNDPHCTADPNSVPKATDVLTPSGVSQTGELDYTLQNPVVLQGVTIP